MEAIGEACDKEKITGVKDVRNNSGKNGIRLVIECEKNVNPETVVLQLFAKTHLETTVSYNISKDIITIKLEVWENEKKINSRE